MPPGRHDSGSRHLNILLVFGVLALALALRLLHWTSSLQSPLSYQPGPDEEYYRRFGEAVAAGRGSENAEFAFMDPGYGYLLGAAFKVLGINPFAIYLLQILVDTVTVYGIWTAGRLLGRPRAGFIGALLYAATSTAVLFCASLLKETWVAAFVAWWIVGALLAIRTERKWAWLCFGAFCGLGVALRSTLVVLAGAALALPALSMPPTRQRVSRLLLAAVGMTLSLVPWSLRNWHVAGNPSFLPQNGGIVLHQIYNEENPGSGIWIPPFVAYADPSDIQRGYAAEAERRAGRPLSPLEVDRYWNSVALRFMREHPTEVLKDVVRKSLVYLADTEVPNNRSSTEERLFSPLLKALPPVMDALLAAGLTGLCWLAFRDRRWTILAAPIVMSWLTFSLFWAEDRFRFHAAPALACLAGISVDAAIQAARAARRAALTALLLPMAVLLALSLYLGRQFPPPPVRWDHVIWGYIKMGKFSDARQLAERVVHEQPDNATAFEALGYIAASAKQYEEAIRDYRQAVTLRPHSYLAHFDLAKAYLSVGRRSEALNEAKAARDLDDSPEARDLESQVEAAP